MSLSDEDHLEELRAATARSLPLDGLAPDAYARKHAAFEALSNQRRLIEDWLVARLHAFANRPLSVLAVGCGDGTLDAAVAERLLASNPDGCALRYVGVEPHEPSARQFHDRMGDIDNDRLSLDTVAAPFGETSLDETFDVVTFVHSMYYVADVTEAVRAATDLLRVGGEAIILSAPRGALNLLAGLLAPAVEGHQQWFSDDVHSALMRSDLDLTVPAAIDAVVDLTDASDDVLDFTVQATLTPSRRGLVRRYLADVSLVTGRSVVAHPVDVFAVRTARAPRSALA